MKHITNVFFLVYAGLFPIGNPVGNAPIFLALTRHCTDRERRALAIRVAINGFFLLFGSLVLGSYVLEFFGLSIPVVQVGGGLVVSALGCRLLLDSSAIDRRAPETTGSRRGFAFYPLTMPLTVGPGSIAVAITIGANHPQSMRSLFINSSATLIGVTLVAAAVFVTYRYAGRMGRIIGEIGMNVLLRLSAFIMLCIGIQSVWNGASALLRTLTR